MKMEPDVAKTTQSVQINQQNEKQFRSNWVWKSAKWLAEFVELPLVYAFNDVFIEKRCQVTREKAFV